MDSYKQSYNAYYYSVHTGLSFSGNDLPVKIGHQLLFLEHALILMNIISKWEYQAVKYIMWLFPQFRFD